MPIRIEDLLFTISIEGRMLSSLSGLVQPMCEGRLDTGSWNLQTTAGKYNSSRRAG
jgi:hypothetical protein